MKPKKKAGRPSKYTPEIVATICDLIRSGNFKNYVAEQVGICRDTFNEWERRYPKFSDLVKSAEGERKETLLQRIQSASTAPAGSVDWKAAAWILERMYPGEFSLHNRIDLQAEVRVSNDQLRAELAELEQRERELDRTR